MDNAELGRRLKAARLAKKMTQSDVVGDFITRNMLSQIESGSAIPSMKTLEYLSRVLEIPMESLFAEHEETVHSDMTLLATAKHLLREKNYDALLEQCAAQGTVEDEIHALRSIAHLELAKQLAESDQTEQLQAAVIHARAAVTESALGLYANADRTAQANQLIASIAQYLSSYYSSLADGIR